jgi:glycosyltransferase involved in cell wall biosynthesis
MQKLLLIISACNEAASLRVFLPRLMSVVKTLPIYTEVLLVSDGSTDDTASVAKESGCVVVINKQNHGIGYSLRLGYKKAFDGNFDFTMTIDADGQHDETLLPKMLNLLLKGKTDIVCASRYHRKSVRMGVPIDRDMLNRATTAQVNSVTGWKVTDPLCGFWGMTRECFSFALKHGKQERYGIHLEHLIKFWYLCEKRPRRVEVPHPAIYSNGGTKPLLTRDYSPANKEQRVERFGTHALHILEVISEVQEILGTEAVVVRL